MLLLNLRPTCCLVKMLPKLRTFMRWSQIVRSKATARTTPHHWTYHGHRMAIEVASFDTNKVAVVFRDISKDHLKFCIVLPCSAVAGCSLNTTAP